MQNRTCVKGHDHRNKGLVFLSGCLKRSRLRLLWICLSISVYIVTFNQTACVCHVDGVSPSSSEISNKPRVPRPETSRTFALLLRHRSTEFAPGIAVARARFAQRRSPHSWPSSSSSSSMRRCMAMILAGRRCGSGGAAEAGGGGSPPGWAVDRCVCVCDLRVEDLEFV